MILLTLILLAAESASLSVGLVFWILFIVGLVFFGYRNYENRGVIVDSLFWWILIFLLGVGAFGFPIHF